MAPDKTEEQQFYVGLMDSERTQRELLEAKKNALILLKRFEKAMLLREQRLYLEGELRSAIGELSDEIHGVMSSFPDLPPEEPPAPKPKPKQKQKQVEKAPKPEGKMSELDRKLAEIDKRISQLE